MSFNSPPNPESKKAGAKYPTLLLLFAFCVFWKLIFTPEYSILTYTDSSWQNYPWFQYIAKVLHQGSFPFWDPYTEAGRFFVGETQTGAFYPLNLLMGLFPLNQKGVLPISVIEGFIILHCFLASLLTYFLALELGLSRFSAFVAGLVFAYSGSVGWRTYAQTNILYSCVWIPSVFLFYSKSLRSSRWSDQLRYINLAGLSLALCLLAGHHQPFICTAIAVICVALAIGLPSSRRAASHGSWQISHQSLIKLTILLFLFALGYSSIQLLSSWEYSQHAYRWVGTEDRRLAAERIPYSVVGTKYALHAQDLVLAIFPFASIPYGTENSPYIGIAPLLFVLLSVKQIRKSKTIRIVWLVALVFLALAMGELTPLHGLFYALVPDFRTGREASRNLVVTHLALALIAGFGCKVFFSPFRKRDRIFCIRGVQIFGCVAVALTLIVFAGYFYRVQVLYQATDYSVPFFTCLLLMMTTLVAVCRCCAWLNPKWLKMAVVIICLLDAHFFISIHIRPKNAFDGKKNFEPNHYYQQDTFIQFLRSHPKTHRVGFWDDTYPQNIGEVYQIETINGYGATRLKQFSELLSLEPTPGGKISDLLNVKYIVSRKVLQLPKISENGDTKVYENPDCLPRAWLVDRVTVEDNVNQLLVRLQEPSFDPAKQALVERQVGDLLPASERTFLPESPAEMSPSARSVRFELQGPNRFTVEAEGLGRSFLVVSQNWYPGWTAKVNGIQQPLMRVDGALMGLFLNPGVSKVEFRFRPRHFHWALFLTMISLLTLIFLSAAHWRVMRRLKRVKLLKERMTQAEWCQQ
jgi:hypothetical protein